MAARVAPPRDSAALAQAIIDVLSDEDARMALACRAQERALAEHADLTTRRYREIYAAMSRARQKAPRPKAGPTVSGASP